ncbi:hypothetical protein HN418_02670 [archaeon]|jgi:hypothetical protein|nr:hypothetical protein [archaeon]
MCPSQDESNIQDDPDVKGDSEVREEVVETPNAPVEPGTPLEHQEGEVFHFNVGQITPKDAVVGVTWCICPEKLEELREAGAENLQILIVVKPKKGHLEQRKLIPVEKAMTHLSFLSPGPHTIQATLLWSENPDGLERFILSEYSRNSYEATVLDRDGKLKTGPAFWHRHTHSQCAGYEVVEMDVPEGFFAKEPPKWLSKWANLWFENPPVDQCSFRRRFILAFTLQPVFFAVFLALYYTVLTLSSAISLSVGKKVSSQLWKHPIRNWDDTDLFLPGRGNDSVFGGYWKWPFAPFTWIVLGTTATLLLTLYWRLDLQTSLIYVGGGIVAAIIVILILLGICWILGSIAIRIAHDPVGNLLDPWFDRAQSGGGLGRRIEEWVRERRQKRAAAARAAREAAREAAKVKAEKKWGDYPACTGVALGTTLQDIPKEKRTATLRFEEIKGKVCRRFRRE